MSIQAQPTADRTTQLPITNYQLPTPPPSPCHLATVSPCQYFPPGHLTLLLGDPGIGKSLLSIDLAAKATLGYPLNSLTNHSPSPNPNPSLNPNPNSPPN